MKYLQIFLVVFLILLQGCIKTDRLHNQAIEEVSQGNYDEAIKTWNKILSIKKDKPLYLNNLGWVLFRNDNLEEAKTTLEKAKLKCNNKRLMNSININLFMVTAFIKGKKFLQEKNYEKAITEFEKVSAEYDTNEMEKKYLALCYEGMGKTDLAKDLWTEIIESYENSDIKNKFYLLAQEKTSSSD